MCGIAGIVGRPADPATLERMAEAMWHRGPDAGGVHCFVGGGLAHRRLSILDLSTSANQPWLDPDGRAAIVFNGEIYNFAELRDELKSSGERFVTTGDTEVLLRGYLRWGDRVVERLNGMFAFAIWEPARRRLFAARDRLGKKPFFYAALPDGAVAFASELKSLLASGLVDDAIDHEGLVDYLHINYVLAPRTILRHVRQLPPAHTGVWHAGRWTEKRYWDLRDSVLAPRLPLDRPQAVAELAGLLDDATRLRMRSDVPMGAFLSGGLDSSTVVAGMRRHGARGLHTFSIESALGRNQDTRFSRLAAKHLETRHHPRDVDEPSADEFGEFARRIDVPLGDDSTFSVYRLSEWTRERVTVALSGDGADEILAGYITYQADLIHRRLGAWRRPVAGLLGWLTPALPDRGKLSRRFQLQRLRQGLLADADAAHYHWRQVLDDVTAARLLDPQLAQVARRHSPLDDFRARAAEVREADWLDQHLYVDCRTWLADDILVKVDRASMAASLEVRSPFLDYRLVEYAARLPREHKLDGWRTKAALRDLAARWLPAAIIGRKKEGFNSPTAAWMRGPLREPVETLLRGGALESFGLRWHGGLDQVWEQFLAGRRDHQYALWGLTMLGLWNEHVRQAARSTRRDHDTTTIYLPPLRKAG